MTIYKYSLIRSIRSPLSIILNCIIPFVLISAQSLWTSEDKRGFYYIGMVMMYGSFLIARGIITDKTDGIIVRIFSAPVTMLKYLSQNLFAYLTVLSLQIVAFITVGAILYNWSSAFILMLLLIYISFAGASIAFSLAWSCLFKNKELSFTLFSVTASFIAFFSGFWFPITMFPDILQYIGMLFPGYWLANGIEALNAGDKNLDFFISVSAINLYTAIYIIFGSKRKFI